jgi:hypothetical protein
VYFRAIRNDPLVFVVEKIEYLFSEYDKLKKTRRTKRSALKDY